MITITITGETPDQIRGHLAWFYGHFNAGEVIADVAAKKAITKAKKTAQPEVATDNAGNSESDQTQASSWPVADAGSSALLPTTEPVAATQSEVTVPTIPELVALASAKSKVTDAVTVKKVIAQFGAPTIKELPEAKRVDLKAALEALQ